ncbi:MAG: sugar transferase [bacterium]
MKVQKVSAVHPQHPGKNGAPLKRDATEEYRIPHLREHSSPSLSQARNKEKRFHPSVLQNQLSRTVSKFSHHSNKSNSSCNNVSGQYLVIRALDIALAITGIIMAVPIFIIVPLLIKLDSPGPVFYQQIRTGIDRRFRNRRSKTQNPAYERRRQERRRGNLFGKPFYIYKFRTMEKNAERKSGPVWAMQNDPRITHIGAWLRRLHIDEIPQLFNVLKGEMSLVGPRPERPTIIADLVCDVPEYLKRLTTKPGVTGLAQVCLGYDECLEDVKIKVRLDRLYVTNFGLGLWLKILFCTAIKVFSNTNIDVDYLMNGQSPRKEDRLYEASHPSMRKSA